MPITLRNDKDFIRNVPYMRDVDGFPVKLIEVRPGQTVEISDEYLESLDKPTQDELLKVIENGGFVLIEQESLLAQADAKLAEAYKVQAERDAKKAKRK